jgi:hypothetical protein
MVKSIGAFFLRKSPETSEMIRSKTEIEFETFVNRYERGSLSPNGRERSRFKILRPECGRDEYTLWLRGKADDGTIWHEAYYLSIAEIRWNRMNIRCLLCKILMSLRYRMRCSLKEHNAYK